jgi:hypothetical protein
MSRREFQFEPFFQFKASGPSSANVIPTSPYYDEEQHTLFVANAVDGSILK